MAITDTQKVDYLWKKIAYGAAKTTTGDLRAGFEEPNPSPLLLRGDKFWQQAAEIQANGSLPTANTSIVNVYTSTLNSVIQSTMDTTVTTYRTWNTGLVNWIPPEIDPSYLVSVFIANANVGGNLIGVANTKISAGGVNSDGWFFDYQAGILNFNDTNLPSQMVAGKIIYISGARYVGTLGAASPTILGNITINGTTISANTANSNVTISSSGTGNVFVSNNLTVSGNVVATYFVGNLTGNITAAGANTQILFNDAGLINATSGLTFDKTANLVSIGGNLTVSGNGSILLPRGIDAQRPSPATTGMFRFSNTSSKVEWYTGSTWQAPITEFTLTTANAQSGDGSTTVFPLPVANASTAGTIISINGIVQRPISAYSITSGNVTFTEAPSATDVVDFRIFTTTSSISTVADIYQTTGMFLDQTSGDQIIHLKTAGVDSLRIEANTKVDISGNLGVGGNFTALTKSFLIDHPTKSGYKLQYASLEGPEHGVYVRGRIEGRNAFELPDYWADLVDPSTISVHITPIGTQQNLYVEDIKNNTVYVAGSIDPYHTKFFYVVYGERKDVDKLSVEYN